MNLIGLIITACLLEIFFIYKLVKNIVKLKKLNKEEKENE